MLRRTIRESKDVNFVVIYTREPHARQMSFKEIAQPIKWEERRDLAKKTQKELALDVLFLVDEMGDPSRKLFGDVPNPAIFVELDGTIREKLSWADASQVKQFVSTWKPLSKVKKLKLASFRSVGGKKFEGRFLDYFVSFFRCGMSSFQLLLGQPDLVGPGQALNWTKWIYFVDGGSLELQFLPNGTVGTSQLAQGRSIPGPGPSPQPKKVVKPKKR